MQTNTTYPMRINNRGQGLVEFSLVLFSLVLMMAFILDFGRAVYSYSMVYNAAREGARYGTVRPTDVTGIQNAAQRLTGGISPITVTVSYIDPYVRVTVVHQYTPATPIIRPFLSSNTITLSSTASMKREDRY
jgi:Flp pilus assembly protein TadG